MKDLSFKLSFWKVIVDRVQLLEVVSLLIRGARTDPEGCKNLGPQLFAMK